MKLQVADDITQSAAKKPRDLRMNTRRRSMPYTTKAEDMEPLNFCGDRLLISASPVVWWPFWKP